MIRNFTAALAASVCIVAIAAPARAQTRDYNVPAGSLKSALDAYARQSGRQVIYRVDDVRGVRSPGARGALTAEAALSALLSGTGFSPRTDSSGALAIVGQNSGRTLHDNGVGGAEFPVEFSESDMGDGQNKEIVVTGSIIRGTAPSGANLIVLQREDLENTGRGSLAEAIQTQPQVHGGGINDGTIRTGSGGAGNLFGNTAGYGASSLNLRGLGVEETLTLVNGRRLAPAGYYGAVADIGALPMVAVERVEILADGASATYGADAMAGVVNIILRRDFEGAETRLRTGIETRSGQPEFQASQSFGWAFDRGNILLAADFARRDGITSEGRAYAASTDLRPFGGADQRLPFCSPGNIFGPADLAGAIPAGQDGRALTPDQIRTGETNLCDLYAASSNLTPQTRKGSVYLTASYDLSDKLRLSADFVGSKRKAATIGAYQPAFLVVPTTNAFRQSGLVGDTAPLDQPLFVAYQFQEAGPLKYKDETSSLMASIGLDYSFARDWNLGIHGAYGRYDTKTKSLEVDTRPAIEGGRLDLALSSSDPATAFNPFGDATSNDSKLVESFLYPHHLLQGSDHTSASLQLSGSLLDLPGGSLKLAVGGDYRRENFDTRERRLYDNLPNAQDGNATDGHRELSAAYAELFIPVFSQRNAVAGARQLSVSLSGRYDHYSDFGSTFNPKAGMTWIPAKGLTVKATYGTSFKAPLLQSLYGESLADFGATVAEIGAPDVDGDGYVNAMYVMGGNPELAPEKGESWTAGLTIEPYSIRGLRLHATYFNLHFTGRFAQAPGSLVFINPAAYQGIAYFPEPSPQQIDSLLGSIDRIIGTAPPSESIEAIIDTRTLNFASQEMEGIDGGISYSWDALGGSFNLSGDVSYLSRYKSRLGKSAATISYIDNVGVPPKWQGRGGLSWSLDSAKIAGWVNYTGKYTNRMVSPNEAVRSYTTVDLSAQIQLGGELGSFIGTDASLAFYVTNLFDRAPPFVNNPAGPGYDGANADVVGRRIALQLTKPW